jgi:cell division transport system permease protein
MKLIGATPWYIKGPFLFEASLYGIVASILSIVATYSTVFALNPIIRSGLEFEHTFEYMTNNWLLVSFGVVTFGILLGFVSSSVALARYLRIKKW